jgi:hypothetical protein
MGDMFKGGLALPEKEKHAQNGTLNDYAPLYLVD